MSRIQITHITCLRCKLTKHRDKFPTGKGNRKCRVCLTCRNQPKPAPVPKPKDLPTHLAIRPSGDEDLPWALTAGGEKYGRYVSIGQAEDARPVILHYLHAA